MRRVVFIILLFLLASGMNGQGVKVGTIFGGTVGSWREDNILFSEDMAFIVNTLFGSSDFDFNSASRIGYSVGMLVDCQFNKYISLQPEMTYTQRGSRLTGTGTVEYEDQIYNFRYDIAEQFDYLDLVVEAKCNITRGKVRPYIIAGPGLGYLISSKEQIRETIDGEANTDTKKVEGCRKIDTHVNIGGGLDFSNSIRIEFRYYHFFKSVFEDTDVNYNMINCMKQINLIALF